MKLYKTKEQEIYYYFLKNGDKRYMYRHKYIDTLGKRREKKKSSFLTEKEALRSLLEVKAAILNGQSRHIEHSQLKVSQWLDIWYETKKRSWVVSSARIADNAITHLKKRIGNYKLNSLTASTYEREFINKMLDEGFKPGSVISHHEVFKTAVNFAVDDEILTKNRFSRIRIEQDKSLDNFLTPSELRFFLETAKVHGSISHYSFTLLLAYSGMRKGEAMGLKWKNIDFTKNTITIECTRDDYNERKPKTKNSYRTIEIDHEVMEQLETYRKWCIEKKLSMGLQLDKKNDYVFITENNVPVYSCYANKFFTSIYKTLKANEIELKKISPHGLRHTHATILIYQLIPPTDIADRLGNTLEMIYRVYAHSFKKTENKTVSAFGSALKNDVSSTWG